MNSSNSDQDLSLYQIFTRHCILNGMSMKDASVLWSSDFKHRNINETEMIIQLKRYFDENNIKISASQNKRNKISTFILTWSPIKYPWDDIDDCINEIKTQGHFRRYWSCGRSKKPIPGDRFFVLRQKVEPRGIVASGYITSEPYIDYSPHNKSGWSRYVDIVYDIILNPNHDKILPRQRLDDPDFSKVNWNPQSSGTQIDSEVSVKLELEWQKITGTADSTDHINISKQFIEGARQQTYTTSFERNPIARSVCLGAHGYSCKICGFNFEKVYGDLGKDFIHVHHLIPISQRKGEYEIDPINDLLPVCPNCHAMLHRNTDEGFISVKDLKEIMKKNSQPDI